MSTTTKKFLDKDGLVQLLTDINTLDNTNIKNITFSSDTLPTVQFKTGLSNGSYVSNASNSLVFKGDTTSPTPTGMNKRYLTISVGGTDKATMPYFDTNNASGIVYSYTANDSSSPSDATTAKAAIDRIIYQLNNLDPDDEKVKQTAFDTTQDKEYPILASEKYTSGTSAIQSGHDYQSQYYTGLTYNPNKSTLTLNASSPKFIVSTTGQNATSVKIDGIGITFNDGSQNPPTIGGASYSGNALGTESKLSVHSGTDDGATMVGYSNIATGWTSITTVDGALDKIITDAVASITGTSGGNETGNYTKLGGGTGTFAYNNTKVTQTKVTTGSAAIPILLTGGTGSTITDTTKFAEFVGVKPGSSTLTVFDNANNATEISPNLITLNDESGENPITTTLTATQYGGNAATATTAATASNFSGTVNVECIAGTTSAAPKVKVTVGSTQYDEDSINIAATDKYGVVRLASYNSSYPNDTTSDTFVPTLGTVKTLVNDLNKAQFVITNYTSASDLPPLTALTIGNYTGKIYLIKDAEHGDTNKNIFDEYVAVEVAPIQAGQSTEYKWELLGTTDAGVDVVTIPVTGQDSVAALWDYYVANNPNASVTISAS